MPNKPYKKPSLEHLEEVLQVTGGILSKTAKLLGCSRLTLRRWQRSDPEFDEAIYEARMHTWDRCFSMAQLVAFGVPEMKEGKRVGWKIRPDAKMLIFLLEKLGREEGFGPDASPPKPFHDKTFTERWIEKEMGMK